jgi:hypothetical protein
VTHRHDREPRKWAVSPSSGGFARCYPVSVRDLFEPEPEPGDRFRRLVFTAVVIAALVLVYAAVGKAGAYLVVGIAGTVVLAFELATLVRLLR